MVSKSPTLSVEKTRFWRGARIATIDQPATSVQSCEKLSRARHEAPPTSMIGLCGVSHRRTLQGKWTWMALFISTSRHRFQTVSTMAYVREIIHIVAQQRLVIILKNVNLSVSLSFSHYLHLSTFSSFSWSRLKRVPLALPYSLRAIWFPSSLSTSSLATARSANGTAINIITWDLVNTPHFQRRLNQSSPFVLWITYRK